MQRTKRFQRTTILGSSPAVDDECDCERRVAGEITLRTRRRIQPRSRRWSTISSFAW